MELLQLYDKNKNKKAGLTEYKDLCIESVLTTGDKKLSFSYSKEAKYYDEIVEEGYIRTKKDGFVIKARDVGVDYTRFDCVLNLEELEANIFDRFESVEQTITASLNLAIVGTGWTVKANTLKKKRTVRCTNKNALEIIQDIKKTYRVDIVFNTLKKQIEIYEHLGEDKGTYFIDSLNLTALQVQSDSYKFATRIIAEGKDGLSFSDINNGKNYVENYQYSRKIKTIYWKDERYTIKESLLEDAKAKLKEISKPFVSYNASILNLAELNPKYKSILDYSLGDTITLISRNNKVKDKQRIVKILEYPQDHSRDTVELANAVLKFEDIQQENQETTDTVNNITTDNGTIDGSTIDGIKVKQIEDFKANVVEVVNLKAINASIDNLHANKADIQDLHAVTAKIGTLEVTKANITQLNAVNAEISKLNSIKANIVDLNSATAKIGVLESKTASIDNLLAGNLTANNFKANSITATSGIIADGAIGSAQISSLSVNKLEAGDITTSKHRIVSADGTIEIVGNQILINRNNVNRVILGEYRKQDNTTEYGLLIRGKDGKTIMLDSDGVHNAGITNGAIDNNKVADNANISGNKLDINSVIREVNTHGTETIKGTKVTVGDRTLDVELSTQKNTITEHSKELSSQKASLTALDNAIKLKVDSQTFSQSTQTINSNINRAKEEAISSANNIASSKAAEALNNAKAFVNSEITTVNSHLNKATAEINILKEKIESKVSQTDIDKSIQNIIIGGRNLLTSSIINKFYGSAIKNEDGSYTLISSNSASYFQNDIVLEGEEKDSEFTFSVAIKHDNVSIPKKVRITVWHDGSWDDNYISDQLTNEFKVFSKTVKLKNKSNIGLCVQIDGTAELGNKITFKNLKLEKGNKATDYTEAPEDLNKTIIDNIKIVTDKISTIESKLTQENNSIKASVQDLNTTTQTITTNVSNINRDLTNKISSNLNAAKNFATDIATNKANTAKQEAISSANSHADSKATEALNNSKAYTNAQVNTVNTKVSNVESNLNILKDKIESKVSQSDIDKSIQEINFNSRNYLLNSKNIFLDGSDQQGLTTREKGKITVLTDNSYCNAYTNWNGFGEIAAGLDICCSVDIKVNSNEGVLKLDCGNNNFNGGNGQGYNLKYFKVGVWRRIYATGKTTQKMWNLLCIALAGVKKGLVVEYKDFKMTLGKNMSDWTPAPEDTNALVADNIKIVDSKISDVSSSITQLRDSVTTQINSINSKTQSIETSLNGKATKQEVTEVNNRVATIKASLDSITQRISSTESKTHTLETSLNTLELNTRNLLLNSNFANKTKFTVWDKNNIELTLKETLESFESEYFGNLLFTASSNGDSYASIFNVKVKANTEYTLAFDYFGAGSFRDGENSSSSYIWFYKDNKVLSNIKLDFKTIGDKKRRRYIKTFMVPNGVTALTIRVGFICNAYSWIAYDGFKLVEGSKNGDWTPAPEDFNSDIKLVSEKINSVESSITQNLNSITQRVSENKTLINSVNGNVTNVVNRVNVVESKITTNAIINSISSGINNNGLSINTVSTILDRTGLTVNNGALRVKNKAGKTVLEGDTGGNLVIKEGAFKVLNPAGDAICAIEQDNFLKVYGLRVFGTNNPVQFIGPGQKGIELKSENGANTYIDFGFANQDFKNRIICYSDKNELILQGRGVEITPDTSFANEAKLEIRANAGGYSYIDFSNNYAEDYSTRLISFNGDTRLHVFGGLVVDSGTKSAMQRTEHYGDRLMYAVEATMNYFEDIYTCSLENGICTVEMDKVFLECVNCNEYEYYLIIDELEECNGLFAPIDLRLPNKFTVKEKNNGKSNAKFNVIVRARRRNFETERLEEMKRHEIDEKILQQ